MQHTFFSKKIGTLSESLLRSFQNIVGSIDYKEIKEFEPTVLTSGNIPVDLKVKLILELRQYFNPSGHISSNIARMAPNKYQREHSDFSQSQSFSPEEISSSVKLQIPVITNPHVAMMWVSNYVTTFDVGGIYIIDNVRNHSVVNFGTEYRYNLTMRYNKDSLLDPNVLSE